MEDHKAMKQDWKIKKNESEKRREERREYLRVIQRAGQAHREKMKWQRVIERKKSEKEIKKKL